MHKRYSPHGDNDHLGEALTLIKYFKIKKVILNKGEINELEEKIINYLNYRKIPYQMMGANDKIKLNNYQFIFLNPFHNQHNENDNSLVLYTILNNIKILLTGDISTNIEKELLNTYKLEKMDILKVSHHGSITSTSDMFLNSLKPKYAVIQVALNNRYHHPHPEIIKKLKEKKIKTLLTSVNGSIRFIINKNKVTIKTAPP